MKQTKRNIISVVALLATLVIAVPGVSLAYGYSEQIDLPRGDYLSQHCRISIYSFPQWIFTCDWVFDEKLNFSVLPEGVGVIEIPLDPRVADPMGAMTGQLQDFIDALVTNQPGYEPPTDEPTTEEVELTPDQIAKLAECFRGYDRYASWGAFVDTSKIDGYENRTRENYQARDGLNKLPDILRAIKAIEECRGIEDFVFKGRIGERESNMAIADRKNIGKDGLPVPQTRGNEGLETLKDSDSTRNIDPLKLAEQRAKEFACTPENQARKLCYPYHNFTGVNEGRYIEVGRNAVYAEYLSSTGLKVPDSLIIAQITLCKNTWEQQTGKGQTALSRWPDILTNGFCDDKLSFEYLRENGGFSDLESARQIKASE